jgi:2-oxoglutarate dehydrogenase E1 component
MAKSTIDFSGHSEFQHIIPDPAHGKFIAEPSDIKRVIYCTGQVYMTLSTYRETHNITDTAITCMEQLHPFPWKQVRDNLSQHPNVEDVAWCQEESLHDGAFAYIRGRLETIFDTTEEHKGRRLRFSGREPTPSVAAGFYVEHHAQEEALIRDAFQLVDPESH